MKNSKKVLGIVSLAILILFVIIGLPLAISLSTGVLSFWAAFGIIWIAIACTAFIFLLAYFTAGWLAS